MNINNRILFLDIDGVLLGKARPSDTEVVLAKYAKEFLEYSLQHYQCFWLTTHCHDGDSTPVINLLKRYAPDNIIILAKDISPVSWKTLKTEVIDINSDFYWVDDQLLWSEIQWLKKNNVLDRWLQVDTRRNPCDFKRVISILQDKVHS
jgi:uncharacterized protein with von Willebrand factor type A (vWA) domain